MLGLSVNLHSYSFYATCRNYQYYVTKFSLVKIYLKSTFLYTLLVYSPHFHFNGRQIKHLFWNFKKRMWLRDAAIVKIIGCSFRRPSFDCQYSYPKTIYKSVSGKLISSFGPKQNMAHIDICRKHTHTYKIIFKICMFIYIPKYTGI